MAATPVVFIDDVDEMNLISDDEADMGFLRDPKAFKTPVPAQPPPVGTAQAPLKPAPHAGQSDTRYISFDIGINNMAFCEATYSPGPGNKVHVERWVRERISAATVKDTTLTVAMEGLDLFLKEQFPNGYFDSHGLHNNVKIIIERQVIENYKATALSHFIIGYFMGLGAKYANIRLWDPKKKPLPEELKGTKRKSATLVEPVVRDLLNTWVDNVNWCVDLYKAAAKKDDLFDAFLQLMSAVDVDIQRLRPTKRARR